MSRCHKPSWMDKCTFDIKRFRSSSLSPLTFTFLQTASNALSCACGARLPSFCADLWQEDVLGFLVPIRPTHVTLKKLRVLERILSVFLSFTTGEYVKRGMVVGYVLVYRLEHKLITDNVSRDSSHKKNRAPPIHPETCQENIFQTASFSVWFSILSALSLLGMRASLLTTTSDPGTVGMCAG